MMGSCSAVLWCVDSGESVTRERRVRLLPLSLFSFLPLDPSGRIDAAACESRIVLLERGNSGLANSVKVDRHFWISEEGRKSSDNSRLLEGSKWTLTFDQEIV